MFWDRCVSFIHKFCFVYFALLSLSILSVLQSDHNLDVDKEDNGSRNLGTTEESSSETVNDADPQLFNKTDSVIILLLTLTLLKSEIYSGF